MSSTPIIGDVYRSRVRVTGGLDRNKFCVICCCDPLRHFFINSEPTPWQKARKHVMDCIVDLSEANYSFLTHDSYLDCYECYDGLNLNARHTARQGELSYADLQLMRAAAAESMSIVQVLQGRILAALNERLDNHPGALVR